jgi:EAL domain-containing protein (putative c-di-GMP-specific phosphodiesterase class I)
VTAEGVETEEQLQLISQGTKVDHIQGFLFGVPLSARDVAELITRMSKGQVPLTPIRKHG